MHVLPGSLGYSLSLPPVPWLLWARKDLFLCWLLVKRRGLCAGQLAAVLVPDVPVIHLSYPMTEALTPMDDAFLLENRRHNHTYYSNSQAL